ncbi:dCTP deaminase domain-containing protein [Tropicimonas isoalkanivorans]|uniref:Deoxycytidine triphosphate deaminase n=1 Tax=Tropicimonas isoalkanivorans TaxID=441112 RepID=A0A1I1JIF2_9RHOB|nr:hypothetical protein [Tropicimonas isoalkanivorans]SFC45723.1 deoxycytidine triphosphate deaminase [Tropicimonas isoalkanivorans]
MSALGQRDLFALHGRQFVIHPCEPNLFTPLGYDLRIGHQIILPNRTKSPDEDLNPPIHVNNGESGSFVFPPQSTSIIVTKERVWLSRHLMGSIHARGSLALRGLFINATTVDPNWDGKMFMRVFNSSPKEERIAADEAFCTMALYTLRSPSLEPPQTNPSRAIDNLKEIYGEAIGSSLYSHANSKEASQERVRGDELVHLGKLHSAKPMVYRRASETAYSIKSMAPVRTRYGKFGLATTTAIAAPYVGDLLLDGGLLSLTSTAPLYVGLSLAVFGLFYMGDFFEYRPK